MSSGRRLPWPAAQVPRCTGARTQHRALKHTCGVLHFAVCRCRLDHVLTRCTAFCRARAPRSPPRALPGQEGGGGSGDRGDGGIDMGGESSDPFFSGGYGRDPANQRWGGR